MRDYLRKLKAWHHNAALLEAKNIFSNGLKRNGKICEAWQRYTQKGLGKFMLLLQFRSHSDNRFLLICIEEFMLRFVGNQEWWSSSSFIWLSAATEPLKSSLWWKVTKVERMWHASYRPSCKIVGWNGKIWEAQSLQIQARYTPNLTSSSHLLISRVIMQSSYLTKRSSEQTLNRQSVLFNS